MKFTVEQVFKDRYTGRVYQPGDIIDITPKRAAEIEAVSPMLIMELYSAEAVEAPKAKKTGTAKAAGKKKAAE